MSDYNGWKNRETWLVNLWFGDDEHLKEMIKDRSEKMAVEYLKDYLDEYMDQFSVKGFVSDMLSGAVSRIDFYDIVQTWKMD